MECNDARDGFKHIFHVDTKKNHWIQYNTRKFSHYQIGITYPTKFFLQAEILLEPNDTFYNDTYNDSANYKYSMFLVDIDRYSGEARMHTQTLDQKNFNKYFNKLKSHKGEKNIYMYMLDFGEKNKGVGYRLLDMGRPTCKKSNKKF